MAVSYKSFLIELYEEYLSDGGAVATQRQDLLANPCGRWTIVKDWEDRLEAYIDGICVGGDLALEICRRRAVEGDTGELHCALRVFCRRGRTDLIEAVLSEAPNQERPRRQVLGEALKHEQHRDMPNILRRLLSFDGTLIDVAAEIIGHQRLPLAALLLENAPVTPSRSVIWALGRLRDQSATQIVRGALRNAEDRSTAALALLRTINYLDSNEDWPFIADGIMGTTTRIRDMIDSAEPMSSLALGLLGVPSTVPVLIARLPQSEAAVALQLITGAGLMEDKAIDDEDLEPGERPTTVCQISCEPVAWITWWEGHQQEFTGHDFFRAGFPYSASRLAQLLTSPTQMHVERYWAAEQLAARHSWALPFEVDMPFQRQIAVLGPAL